MPIIETNEDREGRRASINDKGVRTYTRVFKVIASHIQTDAFEVMNAPGIPRIADPYLGDPGASVQSIEPRHVEDPMWLVEVTWSSETDAGQAQPDPISREAQVEWGGANYLKVALKDLDGKALLNSAGQEFDDVLALDEFRPEVTITRNEAGHNVAMAHSYRGSINSDTFYGAEPGQARMMSISASKHIENGIVFWSTTYRIQFQLTDDGWVLEAADMGYYETSVNGNDLTPILDDKGRELTKPVPLNGSGKAIRPIATAGSKVKFRKFDVYPKKPFAALNL